MCLNAPVKRRTWPILAAAAALVAGGLWWARAGGPPADRHPGAGPATRDLPAEASPRTRVVPIISGAPCRVSGEVVGGRARQVSLHSQAGQVDMPAQLSEGGRRFAAELPEQGPVEVVVVATDGRAGAAAGVCDGSGRLTLRVELPAPSGGRPALSGRCLYLETGAPVAEGRVRGIWSEGGPPRPAFSALAGEDGAFSADAPAGAFEVTCGKDGDESAAVRVVVEPGAHLELVLYVAARAAVAGVVRDAQGPLPGVTVVGQPARTGQARLRATAVSDQDGRFLLPGLPPGPVVLEAQDQGRFAEARAVAQVALPYAEVELVLAETSVSLEGWITADGRPVPGATVEARATAAEGRRRFWARRVDLARGGVSDEEGHYAVAGLAPGRFIVTAQAPGRTPARAEVDLGPGRTRVDLTLPMACETEVRVEPAEPSRPVVVELDTDGATRVAGRTGAPLTVTGPPGPATLYVRALGRQVASATAAVSLCGPPVVVSLAPAEGTGTLEVRTQDASGAPVGGVRVWIDAPGGLGTTAEDGAVRFEGLAPQSYRVGTRDTEPQQVEVRAGAVAQATFTVSRAEGDVSGTVEAAGAPVEGAAILAACADSGRPPELSAADVVARSDGAGAFRFVPEDGSVCLVRAEHPSRGRSQPVLLRAGGEAGRLSLLASATLAGRVVRGPEQAPVPAYTLTVASEGRARTVEGRTQRVEDPSGRFELLDLAPGPVALAVESPEGRGRVQVELQPGEHRRDVVVTVFGNGSVTGRVLSKAGPPLPGAEVRVDGQGRPLARLVTGPDGRFSASVPAGELLSVFVRAEGYYLKGTPTFDLKPEGPTDIGDVVLEPRGGPEEKEGGIGLMFAPDPEGIRIIRFTDDSPARDAGALEGDVITAINGAPFGRDPLVNWVMNLRGPVGTPVILRIVRGTGAPFPLTVLRRAIGLGAVPEQAP